MFHMTEQKMLQIMCFFSDFKLLQLENNIQ